MKVIFLDVDGVIATKASYSMGRTSYGPYPFDPGCVAQLNRIIKETGAVMVMSSTWRIGKPIHELITLLKSEGVHEQLIGVTSQLDNACRGDEIQEWLNTYTGSIESYVILDDDSDFLEHQRKYHVKSSFNLGLTGPQADEAIRILNEEVV